MATGGTLYKLKVVLVGNINVGKTSIVGRFTKDTFDVDHVTTIGACYITKTVVVDDTPICYQIWDTAGQERFRALVPMYMRGAHIAMVVYDVTDPQSFKDLQMWLGELRQYKDVLPVIVANKCDLQRTIDDMSALNLAQEHGIQYVCVSAKSGYNIDGLFHAMGSKAVKELERCPHAGRGSLAGHLDSGVYQSINIHIQPESQAKKKPMFRCTII